ncbi:MAG: hypothetical protein KDJ14_15860 [Xanthomonadales bacterium]|nr:hypothetical protein [Xanthomonadales bacterium]
MTSSNLAKWAGIVACLCLLLALPAVRSGHVLNTDVAWFLVASERMLEGGSPLADFFEINMPLATALYLPVHLISGALHVSPADGVLFWTALLIAHSVMLTARVSVRGGASTSRVWVAVWSCTWTTLVLAFLPGYDFAEREHLSVLLVLPFVWMLAVRPAALHPWLRIYITLVAAVGFYAKPHYSLLPFLLLWFWRPASNHSASNRALRHPEWAALIAVGAANAAFVLVLYPEWFEVAVWANDLYGRFRDVDPFRFVRTGSFALAIGSTLTIASLALMLPAARRAASVVLFCTVYAWMAYWLQGKGWRYQLLPALLFPSALLPWVFTFASDPVTSRSARAISAAVVAVASVLLLAHAEQLRQQAPRVADLSAAPIGEALSITRPGDKVSALSITGDPFLAAVIHYELRWESRFSALWPIIALAQSESSVQPSDGMTHELVARYGERFCSMVAEDLRLRAPDIVLVDLRGTRSQGLPARFDLVAFLSHSARFRAEWSHYTRIGESGSFRIFARVQEEPDSGLGDGP